MKAKPRVPKQAVTRKAVDRELARLLAAIDRTALADIAKMASSLSERLLPEVMKRVVRHLIQRLRSQDQATWVWASLFLRELGRVAARQVSFAAADTVDPKFGHRLVDILVDMGPDYFGIPLHLLQALHDAASAAERYSAFASLHSPISLAYCRVCDSVAFRN